MSNSHNESVGSIIKISVIMISLPCLSGATTNSYHQSDAAGILTMAQCLQCHDGSTGRLIRPCLGNHCLYMKNHSIMHQYPPPRRSSDYASSAEIEAAGCILESGRTTCLSCHDLTKPPPHLIRDGDELCLICHKNLRSRSPK